MRAASYSLSEALVNLRRAGRSAALSIGTVAVAFLTLGGFFLTAANVQQMVDEWASAAEMSVFLRDDIDEATRAALGADLAGHRAVSRIEFFSKEQALARFKTDFPELVDLAGTPSENPFPPAYELQLRTDPESIGAADALAEQLRDRAGVVDVRYDRQWLARVTAIVNNIRWVGVALASVLVLGAAFTVAAVIRLSLLTRRDEIEIMRLVGAPFAFIRGPSVAEGTIIGGLGAALSLTLLFAIYQSFKTELADLIVSIGSRGPLRFLGVGESIALLLAALTLGALTGLVVSRSVR
jgi:cell division transport system permease protein